MSDLSNRILRLIEDKGLSYGELAEMTNLSHSAKFEIPEILLDYGNFFLFQRKRYFCDSVFLTITTSI